MTDLMTEQNDNVDPEQSESPAPPAGSTIPKKKNGVAAGYTGEPSTFEPEEDAAADAQAGDAQAGEAPADDDATPSGGSGQRSTEATGLSGEDRSIFQSHWDEFPGQVD